MVYKIPTGKGDGVVVVVVSGVSLIVVVTTDCVELELVDGIIVGVDVVDSPDKNTNVYRCNQCSHTQQ